MLDTRFPTALEIMQCLVIGELRSAGPVSSAQLAKVLDANPALVRRLVTTLARRGLVISEMGRNGGIRLSRPAERISLAEIYRAAVDGKKLWTARPDLPKVCMVSCNFESYFERLAGEADEAILSMLEIKTLAASFDEIVALERSKGRRKRARHSDRDEEAWRRRKDARPA